MKTFLGAFLVGICINFAAAQDLRTPAEQYQEYLKAYRVASGAFRMAETDQQRKNAVEQLDRLPSKFLEAKSIGNRLRHISYVFDVPKTYLGNQSAEKHMRGLFLATPALAALNRPVDFHA